jgi:ABC-type molybdate transport system substrate-binding protein
MLHRISFEQNDCYFVVRPWGNLLIYPYQKSADSDTQHFIAKGGVYRQISFENHPIAQGQIYLFHKFGAALVTPWAVEYHPEIKIEQNDVDFYDPYITYLKQNQFQAFKLLVKENTYYFLDHHFSVKNGTLVILDSSQQSHAMQFLQFLGAKKGDQFLAPQAQGRNSFIF